MIEYLCWPVITSKSPTEPHRIFIKWPKDKITNAWLQFNISASKMESSGCLKTRISTISGKLIIKTAREERVINFCKPANSPFAYNFATKGASTKFTIMLRNPVDFIHSLHSQHLFDSNETVQDFETAINLDAERKKGNKLPFSLDFFELPSYIESALFAEQVKRYYDVFGKENVKVILYDDFVKDTAGTIADTHHFLGLDNINTGNLKVINPNKQTRFFFLHQLIKNPPEKLRKLMRTILPFKALRYYIMLYLLRWNVRFKKRAEMSEELRLRLKKVFAEDIRLLGEIINRDLSAWL